MCVIMAWPIHTRVYKLTNIMNMQLWTLFSAVSLLSAVDGGNCTFEHAMAQCSTTSSSNKDFKVKTTINTCNNPIDITFDLQLTNRSEWEWQHTFVNADETQPLSGLDGDISLHVILQVTANQQVLVQANFIEGSTSNLKFINQNVKLMECLQADNPNRFLPLVVFFVLLALIIVLLGLLISFHRHQHRKATSELLANMENNTGGTQVYQEEPTTPTCSDAQGQGTTTVIKNDIYRDSVLVEGESLPSQVTGVDLNNRTVDDIPNNIALETADDPIPEGATAAVPSSSSNNSNSEKHRHSKHNKKSRRKKSPKTALRKDPFSIPVPKPQDEMVLNVQTFNQSAQLNAKKF